LPPALGCRGMLCSASVLRGSPLGYVCKTNFSFRTLLNSPLSKSNRIFCLGFSSLPLFAFCRKPLAQSILIGIKSSPRVFSSFLTPCCPVVLGPYGFRLFPTICVFFPPPLPDCLQLFKSFFAICRRALFPPPAETPFFHPPPHF